MPKESSGEPLKFQEKSVHTQMLVVVDGDIVKNQLNVINPNIPGTPLPLVDQFTQAQYGNRDFMLNAIDYMMDDKGLISIRSRELKIRLLDVNALKGNKLFWQLINTALPITLIMLFGIIYIYLRKRKYGRHEK